MTVLKRIWGRLLRWHERSAGQIALYGATGLTWGKNVRAKLSDVSTNGTV